MLSSVRVKEGVGGVKIFVCSLNSANSYSVTLVSNTGLMGYYSLSGMNFTVFSKCLVA